MQESARTPPLTGREAGDYPYFEDVNEGIVRNLPDARASSVRPRVLDLGCGYGRLGAELRKSGYEVWGVELEPGIVRRAAERLDQVFAGDLQDPEAVIRRLDGEHFDYLIFSDVLEHMPYPVATLGAYLPLLSSGGQVLISVPNVANWQTRLALMGGRFTYQDTGVLDRTHLRFFTRRSAAALVREVGLDVAQVDVTPMLGRTLVPFVKRILQRNASDSIDPGAILDSPFYRRYMRWVYPVEYRVARALPGLFAFRVIVTGRRLEREDLAAT